MISPSDPNTRCRTKTSGFTLLEVLISLALSMLVLAVVLSILPAQALRTQQRLDRLIATEFAFSLLEEYRVTYPQLDVRGSSSDWAWSIEERPVVSQIPDSLAGLLGYFEVSVTVWNSRAENDRVSLTTLVARRLQ